MLYVLQLCFELLPLLVECLPGLHKLSLFALQPLGRQLRCLTGLDLILIRLALPLELR